MPRYVPVLFKANFSQACKISVSVSSISTISVLVHLAELFPQEGVNVYIDAILEQVHQHTPSYTFHDLAASQGFMTTIEGNLDSKRGKKVLNLGADHAEDYGSPFHDTAEERRH